MNDVTNGCSVSNIYQTKMYYIYNILVFFFFLSLVLPNGKLICFFNNIYFLLLGKKKVGISLIKFVVLTVFEENRYVINNILCEDAIQSSRGSVPWSFCYWLDHSFFFFLLPSYISFVQSPNRHNFFFFFNFSSYYGLFVICRV